VATYAYVVCMHAKLRQVSRVGFSLSLFRQGIIAMPLLGIPGAFDGEGCGNSVYFVLYCITEMEGD
jgi:hypothetical protein